MACWETTGQDEKKMTPWFFPEWLSLLILCSYPTCFRSICLGVQIWCLGWFHNVGDLFYITSHSSCLSHSGLQVVILLLHKLHQCLYAQTLCRLPLLSNLLITSTGSNHLKGDPLPPPFPFAVVTITISSHTSLVAVLTRGTMAGGIICILVLSGVAHFSHSVHTHACKGHTHLAVTL